MLCGPAAAGKTTHSKALLDQGATLFSPDKWLEDTSEGKYNWTPVRARQAWANEQRRFQSWLMGADLSTSGHHVAVWDATFVDPITRSPILNFSKGAGCRVEAWVLDTPADICKERNAARPEHRRVPESTINRMISSFKVPTLEEGFDLVRIIDSAGKF